jgi:hypothetical protein
MDSCRKNKRSSAGLEIDFDLWENLSMAKLRTYKTTVARAKAARHPKAAAKPTAAKKKSPTSKIGHAQA